MTAKEKVMAMPSTIDPEVTVGEHTNFHFILAGEGGGEVTIEVNDGTVKSHEGLIGDADCVIRTSAENFNKLARGDMNPMMAMMTGKLKISNKQLMMKWARIFGLM